jgi:hypothetical protein
MAEDCIRWRRNKDSEVTVSGCGSFVVKREHRWGGKKTWGLEWDRKYVRCFDSKSKATGCAEDLARIRYGLVAREVVEERYGIDLSAWLGPPRKPSTTRHGARHERVAGEERVLLLVPGGDVAYSLEPDVAEEIANQMLAAARSARAAAGKGGS